MKRLTALLVCAGTLASTAALAAPPQETVVLLHGLGRTRLSMAPLARALEREGYRVLNLSYPSRTQPLETLATTWLPAQLAKASRDLGEPERLHFVTHSMGGILVRLWLREHGVPPNLGRVVMLAPPNAGSELPDRLGTYAPFRWTTGLNGARLGTSPEALPRALGSWPAGSSSLGIIAGSHSMNPLLGSVLPRPHDGKVSVASTHLSGEADHLVLPYSHTWLACRRETARHVTVFLREGRFAGP
jgi:triacylglycerol lipase